MWEFVTVGVAIPPVSTELVGKNLPLFEARWRLCRIRVRVALELIFNEHSLKTAPTDALTSCQSHVRGTVAVVVQVGVASVAISHNGSHGRSKKAQKDHQDEMKRVHSISVSSNLSMLGRTWALRLDNQLI